MALFQRKHFLDADDDAWHLETWLWLLRNHGGVARLKARPLVRPTREFFPPTEAAGHERAVHVFARIKQLAGMSDTDWPCILEAQPERPKDRVAQLGIVKSDKGALPLGTYGTIGNNVVITYDPALVSDPGSLVATLAHELSHYLLDATPGMPPGDHEMHEYATDLTVAFLGFGIFAANLAFNFSQHHGGGTHGWRTSGQGYLRERDWAFALAVFCNLRDEPVDELKPLLKPHIYSDVRDAQKFLARNASLLAPHRAL
jgi:hypothetical protein